MFLANIFVYVRARVYLLVLQTEREEKEKRESFGMMSGKKESGGREEGERDCINNVNLCFEEFDALCCLI